MIVGDDDIDCGSAGRNGDVELDSFKNNNSSLAEDDDDVDDENEKASHLCLYSLE